MLPPKERSFDSGRTKALPYTVLLMKERTIYALGFFDGVHLGHQALLQSCVSLAETAGCRAGAVTFVSHPETLVAGKAPKLINTVDDRKKLLQRFGAQTVVELPFNKDLMTMHWRDFIRLLRSEYGAAGFVCGSDFHFGHKGEGTAGLLQEYCAAGGMPCAVVPQQVLEGVRISSTHIRELLEAGETEQAVRFLGHPHILTGTVVAGRKLGRTLGIPTANLELPEELVVPKFGVYACKALFDGREYLAVTNIGTRPTVGGHHVTVEPWILDFEGDLYGKEISLAIYGFLRPEQKFASLEQLQAEIRKNAEKTRVLLENS